MQFTVFPRFTADDVLLIRVVYDSLESFLCSFYEEDLDEEIEQRLDEFFLTGSPMSLRDVSFAEILLPFFVHDFTESLIKDERVVFLTSLDDLGFVSFPITLDSTFDQIVAGVLNRIDFSASLPPVTLNDDGTVNGSIVFSN